MMKSKFSYSLLLLILPTILIWFAGCSVPYKISDHVFYPLQPISESNFNIIKDLNSDGYHEIVHVRIINGSNKAKIILNDSNNILLNSIDLSSGKIIKYGFIDFNSDKFNEFILISQIKDSLFLTVTDIYNGQLLKKIFLDLSASTVQNFQQPTNDIVFYTDKSSSEKYAVFYMNKVKNKSSILFSVNMNGTLIKKTGLRELHFNGLFRLKDNFVIVTISDPTNNILKQIWVVNHKLEKTATEINEKIIFDMIATSHFYGKSLIFIGGHIIAGSDTSAYILNISEDLHEKKFIKSGKGTVNKLFLNPADKENYLFVITAFSNSYNSIIFDKFLQMKHSVSLPKETAFPFAYIRMPQTHLPYILANGKNSSLMVINSLNGKYLKTTLPVKKIKSIKGLVKSLKSDLQYSYIFSTDSGAFEIYLTYFKIEQYKIFLNTATILLVLALITIIIRWLWKNMFFKNISNQYFEQINEIRLIITAKGKIVYRNKHWKKFLATKFTSDTEVKNIYGFLKQFTGKPIDITSRNSKNYLELRLLSDKYLVQFYPIYVCSGLFKYYLITMKNITDLEAAKQFWPNTFRLFKSIYLSEDKNGSYRYINDIDFQIQLLEQDATDNKTYFFSQLLTKIVAHYEKQYRNITFSVENNITNLKLAYKETIIETILVNIINNGIESIKNSGNISIAVNETENPAKNFAKTVELTISDNGEGFSIPVYQAALPYLTTKNGRLGLGLTVTENLLEKINGELIINSTNRLGATVVILIPWNSD